MKHFLRWLVCLTLFADAAYGQRKEAVRWTKEDFDLGSNWRFHPGDNMAWADSAFSDGGWTKSNSSKPIYENEALWRAGRGWFRTRPAIHNKGLFFTIEQFGLSEIYLDGRRLALVKPVAFDSGARSASSSLFRSGLPIAASMFWLSVISFGSTPLCIPQATAECGMLLQNRLNLPSS